MTRLAVDSSRCEGHGLCYGNLPDVFEEDEFGHASVVADLDLSTVDPIAVRRVVGMCPERAITFEQ